MCFFAFWRFGTLFHQLWMLRQPFLSLQKCLVHSKSNSVQMWCKNWIDVFRNCCHIDFTEPKSDCIWMIQIWSLRQQKKPLKKLTRWTQNRVQRDWTCKRHCIDCSHWKKWYHWRNKIVFFTICIEHRRNKKWLFGLKKCSKKTKKSIVMRNVRWWLEHVFSKCMTWLLFLFVSSV